MKKSVWELWGVVLVFYTCALLYSHCCWVLLSILLLGQSTSCNPSAAVHSSQSWRPHMIPVSRNQCITWRLHYVTFNLFHVIYWHVKDPSTEPGRTVITAFPLGKLCLVQCSLSCFLNHYQSLRESFLPNSEGWRAFSKEHCCHHLWKVANLSLEHWLCPCDGWRGCLPWTKWTVIHRSYRSYLIFTLFFGGEFLLWFPPVAGSSCLRLVPYCHLSFL